MGLSIVTSKNIAKATNEVLEQARKVAGNLTTPTFVLVPDRFTLHVEQLLFAGREGAMFNTHVVSFTKLAHIVSGGGINVLSKQSSVMLLWRAVFDVKNSLVRFGTACNSFTFAEKLYNTINQLVSSGVDFNNLESSAKTEFTKRKFKDIATIYKRYVELIGEKQIDSGGVLKYLIGTISTSPMIKNANIFVCGFENLTPQRMAVVKELVKAAKGITIAVQDGLDKTMLADLGASGRAKLSPYENQIIPVVIKPASIFDECDDIVKNIFQLVKNGYRYCDINLVLGSYENLASIYATGFKLNGIPAYFDEGENLCKTPLFQFVQNHLLLTITGETEYIIQLIKSPLYELTREQKFEEEKRILKTNSRKFENFIVDKLKKCKTASDFCAAIGEISGGDERAKEQMCKIIADVKTHLGDMAMTALQFLKMLQSVATSVKIETVPDVVDSVRVFDCNNPEVYFNKVVMVAAMAQNAFPVVAKDDAIITMQDIKACSQAIVPDCAITNLQNLQTCYNVLFSAAEKLFISCSKTGIIDNSQQPSYVFNKYVNQFGVTENTNFLFNNPTKELANKTLQRIIKTGKQTNEAATLANALNVTGLSVANETDNNIKNADKLFFRKNRTSASQLECFFSCPAKHFYQHGLRLKPFEIAGMNPMDIGKIIHTFCELLVKFPNAKTAITLAENATFAEYKEVLELEQNKAIKESLKKQLKIIGEYILKYIEESEYKPIPEQRFEPVKIGGITVGGQVDRIDTKGNLARIIDYKTGSSVSLSAKEVMLGEKIQLVIYSIALKDKYIITGVYYMPLSGGKVKAKDADKRFKLVGIEDENLNTARQYVEKLIAKASEDISMGETKASVLSDNECKFCEFSDICFERSERVGSPYKITQWKHLKGEADEQD